MKFQVLTDNIGTLLMLSPGYSIAICSSNDRFKPYKSSNKDSLIAAIRRIYIEILQWRANGITHFGKSDNQVSFSDLAQRINERFDLKNNDLKALYLLINPKKEQPKTLVTCANSGAP